MWAVVSGGDGWAGQIGQNSHKSGCQLCAVGQGALKGTGRSPELVDMDLKDMAYRCEETGI